VLDPHCEEYIPRLIVEAARLQMPGLLLPVHQPLDCLKVLPAATGGYLLEPGLGDDQDIARQHIGIGTDISPVDEIIDTHTKLSPLTINHSHDA